MAGGDRGEDTRCADDNGLLPFYFSAFLPLVLFYFFFLSPCVLWPDAR